MNSMGPKPEAAQASSRRPDGLTALVACDDAQLAKSIREQLLLQQVECPLHCVVPVESAADRALRVGPGLTLVVLPKQPEAAYDLIGELSRTVPTHILAVGPARDPHLILQTLNEGGADEYLDENHLEDELANSLTRYRTRQTRVSESGPSGRVISVLAASGGCGSSLVATNVASALARQHGSAALVDLRLANGDLASLMDVQPEYTLADMCDNLGRVDPSMFAQFFARHPCGVHLLAAPRDRQQLQKVHARGVRRALAMARTLFPYVLIDLDNTYSDEQVEALWQSDVVVLVLRLDYTSLRNTKRAIEQLCEMGLETDRVEIVVNRYREKNQLTVSQAEEALGRKVVCCIPDEPARVNAAVNAGIPVVLQRPRARVSRRLSTLATELNGHYVPPT